MILRSRSLFEALDEPNTSFLAWTTTPWTLPSNLALMVGPEIEYVKVQDPRIGKYYILAEARLAANFKEEVEIVRAVSRAKMLKGQRYKPLFPFFADRQEGAFRIILEDSVSIEDGTGIVHARPLLVKSTFLPAKEKGSSSFARSIAMGSLRPKCPLMQGSLSKMPIRKSSGDLKKQGLVFHQGTIRHRYPFCWRSDTPLIYKAVSTWFVAVEKIKDQILGRQ